MLPESARRCLGAIRGFPIRPLARPRDNAFMAVDILMRLVATILNSRAYDSRRRRSYALFARQPRRLFIYLPRFAPARHELCIAIHGASVYSMPSSRCRRARSARRFLSGSVRLPLLGAVLGQSSLAGMIDAYGPRQVALLLVAIMSSSRISSLC